MEEFDKLAAPVNNAIERASKSAKLVGLTKKEEEGPTLSPEYMTD